MKWIRVYYQATDKHDELKRWHVDRWVSAEVAAEYEANFHNNWPPKSISG